MELDKVHQSLTYSSNDITTITKLTSNISYSYTEDFYPNLNLSFSQTAEARLRTYDYPILKRSQSHKRHHFKVDIGTIVNEELNEEDSENITAINYSQCSFSSNNNDLDIINKFTLASSNMPSDMKDDCLSPKTQLLLANLNAELNNTFNKLDEVVPEEEWNNLVSPNYNYRSMSKVLVLSTDNGDNGDNEEEIMIENKDKQSGEKEENSSEEKQNINTNENKARNDSNGNSNSNSNEDSFSHIEINKHNLSSLSNLSNQDPNEDNAYKVGVIPTIFSRILRQEALRNINNINSNINNGEIGDEDNSDDNNLDAQS